MSRKQHQVTAYAVLLLFIGSAFCVEPSSQSAEDALAQAEVSVATARARGALWTTAQNALREARAARNRGDFAATLRWSSEAKTLAELGVAQRASQP